MTFQIIEAIDGDKLYDYETKPSIWKCGIKSRYLLRKEIGCVISHLKIYQKMVNENIELACILEDDNDYRKELNELLVSENINILSWDLLFLGHHAGYSKKETRSRKKRKLKLSNYSIGEPIEIPYGTYAYIIKREAARKLLEHSVPIRMPADLYTGNASALGIQSFVLSPPCVFNCSLFNSTIYNYEKIKYTKTFPELCRRLVSKIYGWFPWLLAIRLWIQINWYFPLLLLRKTGLIKNSYAKYNNYQKCNDKRFKLISLEKDVWYLPQNCEYNALIATHMIEHINWKEFKQLTKWIPGNM